MTRKARRKTRPHPFEAEETGPEKIEEFSSAEATQPTPPAWFTVESLLYGTIVIVALGLRLWGLDTYPLSGAEADQSLAAWALYHGDQLSSGSYSPLLLTLNTLTFLLFGASDATARLATVVLGTVLGILPAMFRRQLGATVCPFASFLLAISPSAIFLARTVNSEIGVAVGALMVVAGFFNWAGDGHQRWLWLAAGGLAVLLTAGPMAYSTLIIFGLIVLLRFSAFKALWCNALRQTGKSVASYASSETEHFSASRSNTPNPSRV